MTSNLIVVRKVLLEPDDPDLRGAPGSNATAPTANEPPCRCRGSAQRERFRTTSNDASHAPSRTISPPPSARSLLRFSWSTASERNRVESITRGDRAARPQCDRERSSASGPAYLCSRPLSTFPSVEVVDRGGSMGPLVVMQRQWRRSVTRWAARRAEREALDRRRADASCWVCARAPMLILVHGLWVGSRPAT